MWIIDNFLPPSLFNDIQRLVMGEQLQWIFSPNATGYDTPEEFYFVHKIFTAFAPDIDHSALHQPEYVSPFFQDIKPILYFLDDRLKFMVDRLFRINCTLCTNQGKAKPQTMHTDYPFPHYTGIYYVNTNNGPTLVGDTKVDSIANRFVLFDGLTDHAASIQDDVHGRFNIVFNMQGHFRQINS